MLSPFTRADKSRVTISFLAFSAVDKGLPEEEGIAWMRIQWKF